MTDEEHPASGALDRLTRLDRGGRRQRRSVNRWDRQVVHDWRWALGLAGRVLITIGLLMFGFVAYQLWGTALETARAQNALENDFEELVAQVGDIPVVTPTSTTAPNTAPTDDTRETRVSTTTTTVAPTTTTVAPLPPIEPGGALGRIEIPRIGLDFYLVAGVGPEELKKGVGHYSETPLPGQLGNSAFAGHRTTYGQPFFHIDEVQPGDEIIVTTLDGRFVYRMSGQQIVSPSAYEVVTTKDPDVAMLTLTSCHPRWSARERIVVTATLDTTQSPPISEPIRQYATAETTPSTTAETTPDTSAETTSTDTATTTRPSSAAETTSTTATTSTTETNPVISATADGGPSDPQELSDEATDAFSHGWFSDGAAWPQVVLWAALATAVSVSAYLVARHFRRLWVAFAAGALPFLVALYFFYQNVNRLLPAAL